MEYYYQPNVEKQLQEKADRIAYDALSIIAVKYGSGYENDIKPEVQDKPYHNLQHSWRVKTVAESIARKLGMSEYDITLTRMIASAHDVIHEEVNGKTAEQASAEWLLDKMQAEGFNEEDQTIACLAIHGTSTHKDTDGKFMGQQFPFIGFPSERAGTIALCVASADMEAAYANYGPSVIHDYFKELNGYGSFDIPTTLDGLAEFQESQVVFLGSLQPLFAGADHMMGGLKQQGIDHHQMILDQLRAGKITTWNQVMALDDEFTRHYQPTRS